MSVLSMTETETAGVRGVAAVVPAWVAGASAPAVGVRVLTQRALRPHQRGLTCGDAVGEAGVRVNLRILTWGDAVEEAGLRPNQRILTWGDAYGVPSLRVDWRALSSGGPVRHTARSNVRECARMFSEGDSLAACWRFGDPPVPR